jgi:hypothetical protein
LAKFFCVCRQDASGCSNRRAFKKLFVAKAIVAATTAAGNANWPFDTILKFVMAQLERVHRKVIVIIISPLRGYLKAIKLFCDVAELPFCVEHGSAGR